MDFSKTIFLFLAITYSFVHRVHCAGICVADLGKAASTTSPGWIQQALAESNRVRADHGAPSMILNDELNQISQNWANTLATNNTDLIHTQVFYPGTRCGENLFRYSSEDAKNQDGATAVRSFYNEVVGYDYVTEGKLPGYTGPIGHFTQLVWKASLQMGCAMASRVPRGLEVYVVCTYWPPGNIKGLYQVNVQPKSGNSAGPAFGPAPGQPGAAGAGTPGQQGRGLPPCALPRPYTGKWIPTGRKRVCNRALNRRAEKAARQGR